MKRRSSSWRRYGLRQKTKLTWCTRKSLDKNCNKIMEYNLDNAGAELATTIAGYISIKLQENLKENLKLKKINQ